MIKFNKNFYNLKKNYLFAEISKRATEYKAEHKEADIIKLGIGDVTLPICDAVLRAMHQAVEEMGDCESFRGYGPYEGYGFLREAIKAHYKNYGVKISADEVYISDGAKSDTSNILELFSDECNVLIPDPTYPVYVDSSIISGKNICYVNANEANEFLPLPDYSVRADIIYICSPNNPTGAVYNRKQLKEWVDYANENRAIILFDAAYEVFIDDKNLPHSIFEIEGSRNCAIEICSFSKNAGFTGIRCGYMVVPHELKIGKDRVGDMWLRRQSIKFNGTSYITQKGALAAFAQEGEMQIAQNIAYYKSNAGMLSEALRDMNIWHIGGKNSPYIWLKCPNNMKSWEFFDFLLSEANVVGTPGAGFGKNGEGFFRLSSFGKQEDIKEAIRRIKNLIV